MRLKTISNKIKTLESNVAQYSNGYKTMTEYANKLSEEIRLIKKDIAAHSRAGITTRYVHGHMKALVEDAIQVRSRALHIRKLRNEAVVELYELKLLANKAGMEMGEDDAV